MEKNKRCMARLVMLHVSSVNWILHGIHAKSLFARALA